MSGKKARKCPFEECYLPDNNVKYIIQAVYLLVSCIFLIKDSSEFTFFSVLMFVAPILLDLVYTKFDGKLYAYISRFYITINTAIAVFCFTGMCGFFVDKGTSFAIHSSSMIWPGVSFAKRVLLVPMIIDLLIPVMMHRACPCKKTKEFVEFGREHRKAGSV